MSETAFHNLL